MMNIRFVLGLGLLFLTSSNFAHATLDEECNGALCSEPYINRPVGEQPQEEISLPYDQDLKNPPRNTLRFPDFDPAWQLKREIFEKAKAYFEQHRSEIENPRYFIVVDFNLHSSKKRFFLFDLSSGLLAAHNVSAGKNSDPDSDGYATEFSNTEGSLMSSLGFYKTLQTYSGAHGYSLRLQGLSSTNSNAFARAIVMHPGEYVSDKEGRAGRSWGCPALDPLISRSVIDKVKNGAMMLIDR